MPKTKIVCTVGPACRAPEQLEKMIAGGLNVVRLNFSHGTHEEHRDVIATIRRLAAQADRPVAILQDLAGPKIRIGRIPAGPVVLNDGAEFVLSTRDIPGNAHEVSVTYPGLPAEVHRGDTLLLADGSLSLEVLEAGETHIRCRVVVGGTLSSHKGINVPHRQLKVPSLTEKDRADLAFGVEQGVDYVALSFVRTAEDVQDAKRLIKELRSDIPLIAKIEKHEALKNIDEIIEAADGIMIARGDLGVETPLESVPHVQKMIIRKCNAAAKPVITATQMLLSMVNHPSPTRAEVTDVANAILDGTDAVMLSDETAVGMHPEKALETMVRIARNAEEGFPYEIWAQRFEGVERDIMEAVSHAACHLAEDVGAGCIVSYTQLGGTPKIVSKYRPRCKILAPTPLEKTYRRLALVWAVRPVLLERLESTDEMVSRASELAQRYGLVKTGDKIVITGGVPVGVPGTTNTVTVYEVVEKEKEARRPSRRWRFFRAFRVENA